MVSDIVSKLKRIDEHSRLRVETDEGTEFAGYVEHVHDREADRWNDPEIDVQLAVDEDDVDRLGMPLSTAYITTTASNGEFDGVYVEICVDTDGNFIEEFERVGYPTTIEVLD